MSEDTESRTGYIVGALINAAMLVVVHKLPDWNVKVITEEGTEELPAELTELGRVGTVPAPFTHPSVRATWGTVSRSLRPKI